MRVAVAALLAEKATAWQRYLSARSLARFAEEGEAEREQLRASGAQAADSGPCCLHRRVATGHSTGWTGVLTAWRDRMDGRPLGRWQPARRPASA